MDISIYCGAAYMVTTREFVDWVMHNETIQPILEWFKDTYSPDEMLWATLVRIEGAPGSIAELKGGGDRDKKQLCYS